MPLFIREIQQSYEISFMNRIFLRFLYTSEVAKLMPNSTHDKPLSDLTILFYCSNSNLKLFHSMTFVHPFTARMLDRIH